MMISSTRIQKNSGVMDARNAARSPVHGGASGDSSSTTIARSHVGSHDDDRVLEIPPFSPARSVNTAVVEHLQQHVEYVRDVLFRSHRQAPWTVAFGALSGEAVLPHSRRSLEARRSSAPRCVSPCTLAHVDADHGVLVYEEGGQLSEAVRRSRIPVVLFDEIEKAHPDVFNVLLQGPTTAVITDGQGRTVDFKNTVVIMTSNIGSQYIMEEESPEARRRLVMDALRAHFRPEFLNRVDEIIIFDRLSEEELKKIVEIQLGRLSKRLEQQKITLKLSDSAKALLAREGYDPVYGARPLRRAIQREILDPLSIDILEGKVREGQTVHVDAKDITLEFREK